MKRVPNMERSRRNFLGGAVAFAALLGFGGVASAGPRGGAVPRTIAAPSARASRSVAVRASASGGGHLHKHVGVSPGYLAARTKSSDMRFSFGAAAGRGRKGREAVKKLSDFRAGPSRISAFHNAPTMDRIWEQAMRSQRASIEAWAKTAKPRDTFHLKFSSPRPVGTVYTTMPGSGVGRSVAASRGEFLLRKGGSAGVYPHTAILHAGRDALRRSGGAAPVLAGKAK